MQTFVMVQIYVCSIMKGPEVYLLFSNTLQLANTKQYFQHAALKCAILNSITINFMSQKLTKHPQSVPFCNGFDLI